MDEVVVIGNIDETDSVYEINKDDEFVRSTSSTLLTSLTWSIRSTTSSMLY